MEQNCRITKEVFEQLKDFKHYRLLSKEEKEKFDKIIIQLIPNEHVRERCKKFLMCKECYQPASTCRPCRSKHIQDDFKNWTSGNIYIDEKIRDLQLNDQMFEWIEYDKFCDVEFIAKGGFGTVYKAKWKDGGLISKWDVKNNKWKRWRSTGLSSLRKEPDPDYVMVALKVLNDSKDAGPEFLRELEINAHLIGTVSCYGISRDPKTNNFIFVFKCFENGSLRNYLNKHGNYHYYLEEQLRYMYGIALRLKGIHDEGMVHRDLHSGNILLGTTFDAVISDVGLSRKEGSKLDGKDKIMGVLPYIAPEVLEGKDYTRKSDIYSFGMLCYEIITGFPPHHDIAHDGILARNIVKGFRPKFKMMVPKLLLDVINQCWNSDPSKRPDAEYLFDTFKRYYDDLNIPNYETEFYKQYDEADEYNKKNKKRKPTKSTGLQQQTQPIYTSHPQAVYTSRVFAPLSGELDLKISDFDEDCYDEGMQFFEQISKEHDEIKLDV